MAPKVYDEPILEPVNSIIADNPWLIQDDEPEEEMQMTFGETFTPWGQPVEPFQAAMFFEDGYWTINDIANWMATLEAYEYELGEECKREAEDWYFSHLHTLDEFLHYEIEPLNLYQIIWLHKNREFIKPDCLLDTWNNNFVTFYV